MDNRRNYYRILHVQPEAPLAVIRSSYRTMMQKLKLHPDLGGDHAQAALINEAWNVLSNPERRARYDASRGPTPPRAEPRTAADAAPTPEPPPAPTQAAPEKPSPPPPRSGPTCAFCRTPLADTSPYGASGRCPRCHSPLAPVEHQANSGACRRAIQRISRRQPLSFSTHWPESGHYAGAIQDLSSHGLSFNSLHRLPLHQVIRIQCDWLVAVARVTRDAPLGDGQPGFNTGVAFITLEFTTPPGEFVCETA